MISVIIPTLWIPGGLLERLNEISKIDSVGEIILIDNDISKNMDLSHISKIVHIKEPKNIYPIPSWNKGVSLAKYDKLLILNDDVETDWDIINQVNEYITPDKGLIGAGVSCWQYKGADPIMCPINVRQACYACLFFVHKNSYIPIPDGMQVWYGDDWLFLEIINSGKLNYEITNWKMGGKSEQTSGLSKFDEIKKSDGIFYNNYLYNKHNKL
jgi:hypothetical protein